MKKKMQDLYWGLRCDLYAILKVRVPQMLFLYGRKSKKKNGKKFLILYQPDPMYGMFSVVSILLREILYAKAHGYEPVIDCQNNKNASITDAHIGKVNGWDIYFQQPAGYSLEEARTSDARYLSLKEYKETYKLTYGKQEFRQHIVLNESMKQYIDSIWKNIDSEGKVLGVLCRGTDFHGASMAKHLPKTENFISFCKQKMVEGGYTKLFLATEDSSVLAEFELTFGDRLAYVKDARATLDADLLFIRDQWTRNGVNQEEKTKNYLAAVYILGRCDAFIANTTTAATPFVFMIKEGEFEYIKMFKGNGCI